jgi:hypothetical protein
VAVRRWVMRLLALACVPLFAGAAPVTSIREVLTATRVYYVNSSETASSPCRKLICAPGSDSHDGLSADKPFRTVQHAIDVLKNTIDLGGFQAYVVLAHGTYSAVTLPVINVTGPWVGGNAQAIGANYTDLSYVPVVFEGDVEKPSNVVLHSTGSTVETITGGQLGITGVRIGLPPEKWSSLMYG